MGNNSITEAGAGALARLLLAKKGSLRELVMYMNDIGDAGAARLATALRDCKWGARLPAVAGGWRRLAVACAGRGGLCGVHRGSLAAELPVATAPLAVAVAAHLPAAPPAPPAPQGAQAPGPGR